MSVTKNEKIAMWTALGIGVVVLIWMLLHRSVASAGGDAQPGSNYLSYNFPGSQPWTGSATGGPQIDAGQGCGSCGCTGGASGGFYTSLQSMLDAFQNGASAAFNSYQDTAIASYPNYVTQYFNNPVAAGQSTTAAQTFGGQMMGV